MVTVSQDLRLSEGAGNLSERIVSKRSHIVIAEVSNAIPIHLRVCRKTYSTVKY